MVRRVAIALLCVSSTCLAQTAPSGSAAPTPPPGVPAGLGPLAEPVAAIEATAKPVRLSLFKNGLGFVRSEVSLPRGEGRFRVAPLPEGTLGTFWVDWQPAVSLSDIRATQAPASEAAMSIADLLEANLGKALEVRVGDKWRQVKIRDIPRREADAPGAPARPPYGGEPALMSSMLPPVRSDMVLLEEGGAIEALSMGQIAEVKLPADGAAFRVNRQRGALEFTVRRGEGPPAVGAPGAPVSLSYLAQGIAWSPSYSVDITDEKRAVLTAKAVIVNDLMPLEGAQVELATGFPYLEYGTVPDAMTLTPLATILARIRSHETDRGALDIASNIMSQRVAYGRDEGRAAAAALAPVMGEASEDLYFYQVPGVTLKKGERGYFTLFTAPVEYEHLYTWDVPETIDQESRYNANPRQPGTDTQVVWHALKLTNGTDKPWTTAPATTIKGGHAMGQATLAYTPPKASTELRVTQVSAIDAEQNEYEVERKRNAAQFYGSNFDLVTVKGELALTNYTGKAVTVKITKTLSGEVQQSDGKPETTKLARGLRMVNPRTQLVWNVEVPPGKDKAVCTRYTYQIYVRN